MAPELVVILIVVILAFAVAAFAMWRISVVAKDAYAHIKADSLEDKVRAEALDVSLRQVEEGLGVVEEESVHDSFLRTLARSGAAAAPGGDEYSME